MRRWFGTLAGRTTAVIAAVATVAVVLAGLLAAQLVNATAVDEAKKYLAVEADSLSKQTSLGSLQDLRADLLTHGARLAAISADGRVTGGGARLVDAKTVADVLAGKSVSRTVDGPQNTVVLEARPVAAGGGVVLAQPVSEIRAAAAPLLSRMLIALAACLVFSIVAGGLLAQWLSRPLVRTAQSAHRLATGERAVAVVPGGPAEVVEVSRALAALDAALRTSEGRQREFLLSISHEIRTPLTALRGYAEALADGVISGAEVSGVGQTLVAETNRLDRFVRDLLELARLESDDFRVELQPVDASLILQESWQAWQAVCVQSGIVGRLELPAGALPIRSDGQRLRQVVDGLLENALRVTPEDSPVVLAAYPSGGGLTVEVRDGGPGLTEADAAVAFERGALFARYSGERPVGSGLGLSIAARIVQRLGGRISVRTAAEGGAAFVVELPGIPAGLRQT
ncbi:sensor histidine kinase KdpD [Arthrobacter sp. AZCC_0090]|uniref:sensor histidine kinase n=1 Tax=Arthrobacter sp. AZCC_0090 TaxID=2735881 RepID=UPI00160ACB83|nr:HAMP domain-containing sensor histidine kinase [Arthrobacter sp. AZCC_0090]MBB6406019.1 two-component system sensor histidine kinase BaeS [Arthrobacter sp. AZCC_0090]